MPRIAELWQRWEAWLAWHAPELAASLGPGATDIALAAAESRLGARLPAPLRSFYAAHDGAPQIVGGHDVATLEQLIDARERLVRRDGERARSWFPFVDHRTGDHVVMERDGAIVEVVADDGHTAVLAASLEAWMAAIVGDLERGLYRWNPSEQRFEPAALAAGFRWLSTEDGRRHAFVLEPERAVETFEADGAAGFELTTVTCLDEPAPGAVLYVERDGERIWQAAITGLESAEESGPGEREVGRSVDGYRRLTIGIDGCDQRYYLLHRSFDAVRRRLERGLAHLKRALSAGEIDGALEELAGLSALSFEGSGDHAASLYKTCARGVLELARGGSVFEATRLVRALLPHVAAIGGQQGARWRFASAAVDVAVLANDPDLVVEIGATITTALDLGAVIDPESTPAGVAALYNLACLCARFGDRDGCLRYAELALERKSPVDEMRDDADFLPVAKDPGFIALLARFDRPAP